MNRVAGLLGAAGLLATIGAVALSCNPPQRRERGAPSAEPVASAAPAPRGLRVPPERLSRVEISRGGPGAPGRSVTLARTSEGWSVTSPLAYRANQTAVDSIVAVLAEIEIVRSETRDAGSTPMPAWEPSRAIEVKAWGGDRLESHFRVGPSQRDATWVQRADDPGILEARGRFRGIFDKSLDELRHPLVTDLEVTAIARVTYENRFGRLELVANPREPGSFVARGPAIRNFDERRASKNVAVLARLFAKGFVDTPGEPADTGLFDESTPCATLTLREGDGTRALRVWVGARTPDGRLHVRTSESAQIYLVSAHLESSLVVGRAQLERSDALMREIESVAEGEGEERHGHGAHEHPASVPSQVPAEMMRELRALARTQTER